MFEYQIMERYKNDKGGTTGWFQSSRIYDNYDEALIELERERKLEFNTIEFAIRQREICDWEYLDI